MNYRRITGLEEDPLFLAYIQHPLIRSLTQRYIGAEVSIFRAMFMNKPAHQGTVLPWHQDVGEGWGLDRNPIITIWTALDDATSANGCMQIVPGSHKFGVINPQHFVSEADQARYTPAENVIDVEAAAHVRGAGDEEDIVIGQVVCRWRAGQEAHDPILPDSCP